MTAFCGRRVSWVDSFGRVLKSISPLGQVTSNSYDGQTRLIKTVLAEGNSLEYHYDDAPFAKHRHRGQYGACRGSL